MRISILLTLAFAVGISACDDEKTAGPGSTATFVKVYGSPNEETAHDMLINADGTVAILATQEIVEDGNTFTKIKILQVDELGNEIWSAAYPEVDTISYEASSIMSFSEGYLITGTSINADSRNALLLQINQSGSLINTVEYSLDDGDTNIDGVDAVWTSQNELRFVGVGATDVDEIWIGNYSADLTFNPECSKRLDATLENARGFKSMYVDNDNLLLGITGTQADLSKDNARMLSISTSCFPQIISGTFLSNDGSSTDYKGQEITKALNGFAMVGTSSAGNDDDIFMARLDNQGLIIGSIMHYGMIEGLTLSDDEEGLTITATQDGGFLIAGSSESNSDGSDIILIKTTLNGSVQWYKFFGDANDEQASVVRQAADGGYFVLGETEFGGINTLILLKTDSQGLVN